MSYISIDPDQGTRIGHVMVDAGNRSLAALQRLSAAAAAPGLGSWAGTVGSEVGFARAAVERHVHAWLLQGEDMARRISALVADQQASSAIGAVGTQPAAQSLLGVPVIGGMSAFGMAGLGAPTVGGTALTIAGPQNLLLTPSGVPGMGGTALTIAGQQNGILGPAVVGDAARAQEMAAAGVPPLLIAAAMGIHIPGGVAFSITGHSLDITAHSAANAALNGLADQMVGTGAIPAIPIAAMQPQTFTSMTQNRDGDGWVDGMDPTPTYYNPGSVIPG